MTDWLGSEEIVDAAVAKLKNEMPGRVAAINARRNDQITAVCPSDNRYYTAALRLIPPGGPALLVMDGRMSVGRGEGTHSLGTSTSLGVWVIDEDSDEQRLARKLWRLSAATIESLWDGNPKEQLTTAAGAPLAWRITPAETVPGPAFEPEGNGAALRQFYLTVFTVQRLEGLT